MLTDDEREMTEILGKTLGDTALKELKEKAVILKELGDTRYALTHEKLDRIIELLQRLVSRSSHE